MFSSIMFISIFTISVLGATCQAPAAPGFLKKVVSAVLFAFWWFGGDVFMYYVRPRLVIDLSRAPPSAVNYYIFEIKVVGLIPFPV